MLAQNPRSLIFAQLADAYRQGGRLEEAIRTCEEGLSQHQNYASAYMVLGRAYKEKGGVLPARDAFRRVLDLDPESVLAHHFLGQIAEAQGEIPEALSAYQAALTLHPFDKDVRASVERLRASTAAAALLSERPDVSPRASLSAPEPVTAMPAETAREEPVAILVAWRDAFRRLKTARGATRSGA